MNDLSHSTHAVPSTALHGLHPAVQMNLECLRAEEQARTEQGVALSALGHQRRQLEALEAEYEASYLQRIRVMARKVPFGPRWLIDHTRRLREIAELGSTVSALEVRIGEFQRQIEAAELDAARRYHQERNRANALREEARAMAVHVSEQRAHWARAVYEYGCELSRSGHAAEDGWRRLSSAQMHLTPEELELSGVPLP